MNFYGNKISKHLSKTPEGYLICKNVPIGRSGSLKYLGEELGEIARDMGIPNNSVIKVYRTPEENSSLETLASFEGKPITNGHPDEDVTPDNFHYYSKGHLQNVRNSGKYIIADLFITDPSLIEEILSGKKREVSCGYDTVYASDDYGNLYQTEIRGNHLAIVDEGRAGSFVKIQDSKKEISMDRKRKAEKIFRNFIQKVKDAESVEEMNEIIEDSAEEIEEMIQDQEPPMTNPQGVPPVSPEGQQNSPVSNEAIMEMIAKLNEKIDALSGGAVSDGTPEGDLDKAVEELSQETPPTPPEDKGLQLDEEPEEGDETTVEDEDAVGGENGGIDIDEQKTAIMNDTASKILKSTREAIASMKDPNEKRRVADAALKAVRELRGNKGTNSLKTVVKNTTAIKDSKQAKKWDEEAQDIYTNMNPHMKRKYNGGN